MQKVDWDLISLLRELAEKFQPELMGRVRTALQSWELRLLDYVFENYYQKENLAGRWYDPYHILFSTYFATQLRKAQKEVSPEIVPAAILHDIGYYAVDKENWSDPKTRITHMQEGAALSARILLRVGGFSPNEIGTIVGMVATHDNGYLGIPTADPDRLALRDADRAWVMHLLSFYKDWLSRLSKKKGFSTLGLFGSRLASFYSESEPFPESWGKVEKITEEDRQQREIPFTELAKQWRAKQFGARWQEIQQNILADKDTFWQYAEEHIRTELEAGRA